MRAGWNRNIHYHDVVLNAVPAGCRRALDVGCGGGRLAAALAGRCREVVAIDADLSVLVRARETLASSNVRFVHGDVMSHTFDDGSFDLVTSIATLHHLPLEPALDRFKVLLRPGGTLAVVGLYRLTTLTDLVYAHVAIPVSAWHRATKDWEPVAAPIQDPKETLADVQAAVERALPGAEFTRRLLFRYSILWRKPGGTMASVDRRSHRAQSCAPPRA